MPLNENTLKEILTSNEKLNKDYGIATEKTFDSISSLLYSYGAITSQGD